MTLTGTGFVGTSLKNTSFKNTVLIDVLFRHSDVKHTIFDGATMDKVTYALLKGAKASLHNVTIQ
jgi:BTB/POZ domain-containing protein KCTD9